MHAGTNIVDLEPKFEQLCCHGKKGKTQQASLVKTKRYSMSLDERKDVCFFCEKVAGPSEMHIAQTPALHANVRRQAELLQDQELI